MKNVISFSLWGDKSLYLSGAIWNATNFRRFYPDWSMRIYHDGTVPSDTLVTLGALGVELRRMPDAVDCMGLYWRFNPMFDDPTIERFIVRDTDSRINQREVDAVNYWIESGKPLHIIRDCESHDIPILGGTWGAIAGCVPMFNERMGAWMTMLRPCYNNPRGAFHGSDQMFLQTVLWPMFANNHVAHIRAGVEKLKFTGQEIELPELVNNEYIGRVW